MRIAIELLALGGAGFMFCLGAYLAWELVRRIKRRVEESAKKAKKGKA